MVYGGEDKSSPMLQKMCGIQTQSTVVTSLGNKMHLDFKSDVTKRMKGYHINNLILFHVIHQ